MPVWVWLLLGAVVVGVLASATLVSRARRRRTWRDQLVAAEAEVTWFARDLAVRLRASSYAGVVGGWQGAGPRVAAVEDRLTVLGSAAPTEPDSRRAMQLRDGVRGARDRMEALVRPGPHDDWASVLDEVRAVLEAALEPRR
ncbi:MAG: hypothetical protein HOQ45_16095 [Nocardioidaceae bacterium]|nr:hypothetical protein [Nocardioidaceae bacterium]